MEKSERSFWSRLTGACWRWIPVLLIIGSCKDKYNAPVHNPPTGYLVVEGFINIGGDSTKFTLSRTTGLDSPYIIPENGATISIQASGGSDYPLTELGSGRYALGPWNVDMQQQYRISIKTVNGKEYQSDFSIPKLTPPIDSISWKPASNGSAVNIYVTTHDATNNSVYYQWSYREDWEYTSQYISTLIYAGNDSFVYRPDSMQYHVCYQHDSSTDIIIGSTAKLAQDLMFEFPLELIPYGTTDKLVKEYSIQVTQKVLTKEWYEWNQKVQKNTEQVGSIFDAQPSDITGNIHSLSDASEPVIGYVGCSSETRQRMFISRGELPPGYIYTGYEYCIVDTVKPLPGPRDNIDQTFSSGNVVPLAPLYSDTGVLIGYTGAENSCVDCRLHGGVLTKPDFWPY
ncbi:MAG TPA: DUF4249 domain-containing protein [Puia sp.]|nr:DUF4249 domain-containing protein [Puia sp.]